MLNFDNDVQDFIERTWKNTVCDGFGEYKTFWETWVGTQPSDGMALVGYDLSFADSVSEDDRSRISRDTELLRSAHYGVFVNLASVTYYIEQLETLLNDFEHVPGADRQRLEELSSLVSITLDSCWVNLGQAFHMVFRLSAFTCGLKTRGGSYKGYSYVKTILMERDLNELLTEFSTLWDKRVRPYRVGYTHFHPYPTGRSGRTWLMAEEPLVVEGNANDPTMLEQSSSGTNLVEVRELLRSTVEDVKRVLNAIWPLLHAELEDAYSSQGVQPVYINSEELALMLAARQQGPQTLEHATPIYEVEEVDSGGLVLPAASGGYNPDEVSNLYSNAVSGSTTFSIREFRLDDGEDWPSA